jgi:ATP-dependent Clp protease ATP-binding subunit ClpA
MYERFTDRAREVMSSASQEAHYFFHKYIATEHVLLAILDEGSGVAANALRNLGLHMSSVRPEVEKLVQSGPYRYSRDFLPLTPRVKALIAHAIEEAELLDDSYVGTEHLLLGLVRQKESVAAQVLMNLGVKLEEVRGEVLRLLGREIPAEPSSHVPPLPDATLRAAERERIRSLEQQLWNVRVVLGALVGALTGALLAAQVGAVLGLLFGGGVAALGWRIPAVLAGSVTGILAGSAHFASDGAGWPVVCSAPWPAC